MKFWQVWLIISALIFGAILFRAWRHYAREARRADLFRLAAKCAELEERVSRDEEAKAGGNGYKG